MKKFVTASLLVSCAAGNVINGNMTFDGKERTYVMYVPTSAPTALIVVLNPVLQDQNKGICEYSAGTVSQETGALVVCPAALARPDVKSSVAGACWKAWANYGTCESTSEDSEDVDFLAALIQRLKGQYQIPEGHVIMSGMSNGGSMAYRFNCEKSELIGGLVIQSQAFLDPYVGYYDYVNGRVPTGTPQCNPQYKRPLYTDIGTTDPYYGPNVTVAGFRGWDDWHTYSTQVLGCTEDYSETSQGPHDFPEGSATTCYEYKNCPSITAPGINRFCQVTGMGHDATGLKIILPAAMKDFFGVTPQPTPAPAPTPAPTGKDYTCYEGKCYNKPGQGTEDEDTCRRTCSSPGPSPSPPPSSGDYLCYQGQCYNKAGSGTMDQETCQRTCSTTYMGATIV